MPHTEHTLQLQNQTEVRPGTAPRSARLYSPERSSRRDFRSERPTLCREHQWEPAPWSPPVSSLHRALNAQGFVLITKLHESRSESVVDQPKGLGLSATCGHGQARAQGRPPSSDSVYHL